MPRKLESDTAGSLPDHTAVLEAVGALLAPLARLCVAKGLPFAAVEEQLKQAFVDAARLAQAGSGQAAHRMVSRISTTTGINRREVTRLTQQEARAEHPTAVSQVSELFTRWITDRKLRQRNGEPKTLPRQGPQPSFESLARSVTQDVHPRSLLDELCRLGLASWDESEDTVSLLHEAFVPRGDLQRMLAFLGDNAGDHLRAAVDNVLGDGSQHFEQAVFADELSVESLDAMREFARSHWQELLKQAVPMLEQRIEADREAGREQNRRVRIGLYTYQEQMVTPAPLTTTEFEAVADQPHRAVRKMASANIRGKSDPDAQAQTRAQTPSKRAAPARKRS